MRESSGYNNGFFEVVDIEQDYNVDGKSGTVKRSFVRRSPGIRALIVNDKNQILLSKEYRYELEEWDYRLPGGKVFDKLSDYKDALENDNIMESVIKTVAKEVSEEVGIIVKNPKLIKRSIDGASVVWDLYYFEIKEFSISDTGANLEENEFVNGYEWYDFPEIIEMCNKNLIHEDRTVGVILTYILNNKKSLI